MQIQNNTKGEFNLLFALKCLSSVIILMSILNLHNVAQPNLFIYLFILFYFILFIDIIAFLVIFKCIKY